ncbi:MAG: nuclease-related domain-containing protein [Acidimicrobiia bacterium]
MTQLIETRWTRYGKDRVYLKTADGDHVGHVDLVARTVVAKAPHYATELQECLIRWTGTPEAAAREAEAEVPIHVAALEPAAEAHPSVPVKIELPATNEVARDLAANVAGAAALAKRNQVNAQAPVLHFVARVLGVKTDERAWRVGANGEEKVANELAKLGPVWRGLHAIEVGENGSDIDHIVIGPPGVITLNTKRRPRAKAWVGERMVMVNGQKTNYLRNSRFEAQRAARLLSEACRRPIAVTAAVVFVDLDDFTVKQMPADVHVTTRRRLVRWLQSLPTAIDGDAVDDIYSKARLSSTWK